MSEKKYGAWSRHLPAMPFEAVMLGAAVFAATQGNIKHVVISLFTFLLCLLPVWFERVAKVRLSSLIQFLYVGFVFASMFAGEVLHIYGIIIWWDDAAHLVSGVLIGLGGLLWLDRLIRHERIRIPIWFRVFFIFCFVAAVATVWEVIEFSSDTFFGTFSQRDDLFDTMTDLVYDVFGGLVVSILAFSYYKEKNIPLLTPFVRHFRQMNP